MLTLLHMLGLLLQDRTGKLANGAIANLVDEVGGALVFVENLPMNVLVDMSICYLSIANIDVSHLLQTFFVGALYLKSSTCLH